MATAPTISIDDIIAEISDLRHEVHTLGAQNESLRKRLDNDEDKRLQAKLDRATAKIAELLREREGLLTKDQSQAVRDVAAARVKAAEAERDRWKAKAGAEAEEIAGLRFKLDAVEKIVGRP